MPHRTKYCIEKIKKRRCWQVPSTGMSSAPGWLLGKKVMLQVFINAKPGDWFIEAPGKDGVAALTNEGFKHAFVRVTSDYDPLCPEWTKT